jgi:penicillin-binding protein 1A
MATRLYSEDGQLISSFAAQNRFFLPIEYIPDHVKNAFLELKIVIFMIILALIHLV